MSTANGRIIRQCWSGFWLRSLKKRRGSERNRRGAVTMLIAFLMTALVVLIAVEIDMAYLHLSRTELRAATDAASKAAAVTLSQTQDLAAARREGIRVGGLNKIGGKP
ncbi:MAG: hypothetical protein FJ308_20435, partial [Planctomycetes bacterium]|nr:hypothetical protein [Planctomycetota bacterium]